MKSFADLDEAIRAVEDLREGYTTTGHYSLPQILDHAAQSVEYSLEGFPRMKPALFRWTVGRVAFGVFDRRGYMKHPLDAPVPGAPPLGTDLPAAIARLTRAFRAFAAHEQPLRPHFAYGALDKAAYTRAHLMHLADHWREIVPASR